MNISSEQLRVRPGDQALPTAGHKDVSEELLSVIDTLEPGWAKDTGLIDIVSNDFRARIALGVQRYGHRLQSHNGRDALLDEYQELLDAAHYEMQACLESWTDVSSTRTLSRLEKIMSLVFEVRSDMRGRA